MYNPTAIPLQSWGMYRTVLPLPGKKQHELRSCRKLAGSSSAYSTFEESSQKDSPIEL